MNPKRCSLHGVERKTLGACTCLWGTIQSQQTDSRALPALPNRLSSLPSSRWRSGEPWSWLAPAEVGSFGAIPGEEHDRNKPDGSSFCYTMAFTRLPRSPPGPAPLYADINKPQVPLPPHSSASRLPAACVPGETLLAHALFLKLPSIINVNCDKGRK